MPSRLQIIYSQVEAQQGGMAEQRDRLHALLASQAVEKEALESEALASAAERAGLASQRQPSLLLSPKAQFEPWSRRFDIVPQ